MIEIENLNKVFKLKSGDVEALKDVSLEIKAGEKYGVIGYSGAGKSTLVRCLNFLETPDSGTVSIDGNVIKIEDGKLYRVDESGKKKLTERDLNKMRRGIGMIFQHFNLLDRSTVFDNIAYPLKYSGKSKKEISDKVFELLDLVGLRDKVDVYPSQLSGGQKQRVAIARALANEPKILLSDEATSALDPDATESILNLLLELNKKLGLTIVLITHEMAVIKSVCDRVAVMEDGRIVEEGRVYDIFSNPKAAITKKFISTSSPLSKIDELIKRDSSVVAGSRLYKRIFDKDGDMPVSSEVSRKGKGDFNIVLANVEVIGNEAIGAMIVKLEGEDKAVDAALTYLSATKVRVEVLA